MARTRILEGNVVGEDFNHGAVFYDTRTMTAFGPIFQNTEEAERFISFLAGVDPVHLSPDTWQQRDYGLYKLWFDCGKPEKRPLVQLDESYLHKSDSEHGECLDCDGLIDTHREGRTHCDCGESWVNGKCEADDGSEKWSMACSLVEHCFPLFNGYDNHDVTKILKKAKVIGDCETDPESSCFYAYFKTKAQGEAFLSRLNGWLRDNWYKAYIPVGGPTVTLSQQRMEDQS